jgi:hypothetical protein
MVLYNPKFGIAKTMFIDGVYMETLDNTQLTINIQNLIKF